MSRIVFLIDGFNLYHALDYRREYHKYKWINLAKLSKCFVTDKKDSLAAIYYFTTLATWDPGKVSRHRLFIKAQEAEGVNVVYGEFKRKDRYCPLCRRHFRSVEEKQTDVNIAIYLFRLAVADSYDKAIIISGDTDLTPAVKAVQATFPMKPIGVVLPIGRASEDFKQTADFHYKMKERHLQTSRFDDTVVLADGTPLSCPPNWK
jgi:uncharacterized LabA/DUF88 family protein